MGREGKGREGKGKEGKGRNGKEWEGKEKNAEDGRNRGVVGYREGENKKRKRKERDVMGTRRE